jgi:putative ABC transport system permease protein
MVKHYFLLATRHLMRNKLHAALNLLLLSFGFSFCFILLVYVFHERSFDTCHVNRDRICRVITELPDLGWTEPLCPYIMVESLTESFPQVIKAVPTRVTKLLTIEGDKQGISYWANCSTQDLFDIFSFKILQGNPESFLTDKHDLIISSSTARKLFADEKVLGKEKSFLVNGKEEIFIVKGVFEDLPGNSSFQTDMITRIDWAIADLDRTLSGDSGQTQATSWKYDFFAVFLLLDNKNSFEFLRHGIKIFNARRSNLENRALFNLQIMNDFYFGSAKLVNNNLATGNNVMILVFFGSSMLILIISSINYILLAYAQSMRRYKEIALRRVSGALPVHIFTQFLGEALILTILGFLFSMFLVKLFLPMASPFLRPDLQFSPLNDYSLTITFFILALLVGLISSLYLSIYTARLDPAIIFARKGNLDTGKGRFWKFLIVLEMVLFMSLILISSGIQNQLNHLKFDDPGFNAKNLIKIYVEGEQMNKYSALQDEFAKLAEVVGVSGGLFLPPTGNRMVSPIQSPDDPNKTLTIDGMAVDYGCLELLGIRLVSGRFFSREFPADSASIILTESAARAMNVHYSTDTIENKNNVIGIVQDFVFHSSREKKPPVSINYLRPNYYGQEMLLRYETRSVDELRKKLEKIWKAINGDIPYNDSLMEECFGWDYEDVDQLVKLLKIFSFISVLISIIGLSGLSMYLIEKRNKEIGIRKVNGAEVSDITRMIIREFMVLVVIAVIISWPACWIILKKWQQNFAYQPALNLIVFLSSFLATAIIVILSILFHIWKASRMNPVDVLKQD